MSGIIDLKEKRLARGCEESIENFVDERSGQPLSDEAGKEYYELQKENEAYLQEVFEALDDKRAKEALSMVRINNILIEGLVEYYKYEEGFKEGLKLALGKLS
ncbi:hypothetical protein [Natronospora cellulosivora (SeqCode)]